MNLSQFQKNNYLLVAFLLTIYYGIYVDYWTNEKFIY